MSLEGIEDSKWWEAWRATQHVGRDLVQDWLCTGREPRLKPRKRGRGAEDIAELEVMVVVVLVAELWRGRQYPSPLVVVCKPALVSLTAIRQSVVEASVDIVQSDRARGVCPNSISDLGQQRTPAH